MSFFIYKPGESKKNIVCWVTGLVILLWIAGCGDSKPPRLTFSFQLNEKEGFIPSNQIAIWLQNVEGDYLETFFVCDYLSYGGYTIPDVCPHWSRKSQWNSKPKETVDAVSQATPDVGNVVLSFDFLPEKLVPGKYKYYIEIHVAENYNELYSGEISIEKGTVVGIGKASVVYVPDKYPKGNGLLSDVTVNFEK